MSCFKLVSIRRSTVSTLTPLLRLPCLIFQHLKKCFVCLFRAAPYKLISQHNLYTKLECFVTGKHLQTSLIFLKSYT